MKIFRILLSVVFSIVARYSKHHQKIKQLSTKCIDSVKSFDKNGLIFTNMDIVISIRGIFILKPQSYLVLSPTQTVEESETLNQMNAANDKEKNSVIHVFKSKITLKVRVRCRTKMMHVRGN